MKPSKAFPARYAATCTDCRRPVNRGDLITIATHANGRKRISHAPACPGAATEAAHTPADRLAGIEREISALIADLRAGRLDRAAVIGILSRLVPTTPKKDATL